MNDYSANQRMGRGRARLGFILVLAGIWLQVATALEHEVSLVTIEALVRRLEVVEKRGLEQELIIKQQNDVIQQQRQELDTQAKEIEALKEVLNVNDKLENPEVDVLDVEKTEDQESVQKSDRSTETGHQHSRQGGPANKRLVLDEAEGPIAFHARIDQGAIAHIGINQKLVFDITVLNLGRGYHNSSGIFTAPAPGLYFFSLSVCILHSGDDIHADIMKNGVQIAGSYAYGYDQGSVSTILPLNAGDEVWVTSLHHPDTYLYGDTLSSFMGYMVTNY